MCKKYQSKKFYFYKTEIQLVIDRYGNFHLTDTDMLIITNADTNTDKKKTNSPIPIPIKKKLLDTDADMKIC